MNKYIFRDKEDSLTWAIFSRLFYLPVEIAWAILHQACDPHLQERVPGNIKRIEFWPKWNPEGTENKRFVEPDILIQFEYLDLLVEAKRRDGVGQGVGQWQNEIQAYLNEIREDDSSASNAIFLAIGGNSEISQQDLKLEERCIPMITSHWRSLLRQVQLFAKDLDRTSFPCYQQSAHRRIAHDIIGLFAKFGFSVGEWFCDVNVAEYSSISLWPEGQLSWTQQPQEKQ